jgi:D-alanine---D-serine ligase
MRKKIAVLFGGCSPEYKISLESAYGIISHIDTDRFEPVMLGISPAGEWYLFTGPAGRICVDDWNNDSDCVRAVISPCRGTRGVVVFKDGGVETIQLDAALPVMHGRNGEDGTAQGLLELAGIPVIGCKTLCSALCMDKDRAHRVAASFGVRVPRSFTVKRTGPVALLKEMAREIGFPLFVKPLRAGSSFGITRVNEEAGLVSAVDSAYRYDDEVIVEEAIPGFEVGCAVLGNGEPVVGEIDEIELAGGMFDFKEKYTLETASIHVPARIPAQKADEIKKTAKTIYKALGCTGFARVDMFLTPDGGIVFNEVNTIPGFTAHSRYPGMFKAAGVSLTEIITRAIESEIGA